MAKIFEIQELLNKYNVQSTNHNHLYDYFSKFDKYTLEKHIAGCVFLKTQLDDACQIITLQNIYNIINSVNTKFLHQIQNEYNKFVENLNIEEQTAKKLFKTISKDILNQTNKSDSELSEISTKFVNDIAKVKEISKSISANLDTEIATKLYTNCINRMHNFYLSTNPDNIKNLINYLLNSTQGLNKPTSADLLAISERCATFYSNATLDKVNLIKDELLHFANFIYNKFEHEINDKNKLQIMQYQAELKAKDLRNILLTTPSVFTEKPSTIKFNIELIKGSRSLGDLINQSKIEYKDNRTLEKFKNIRLNFSAIDMQKLYISNLSALSISPTVLLNTLKFIDNTANKIFEVQIDPNLYLSPETFSQLQSLNKIAESPNAVTYNYWQTNLELLSKIMSKEKLQQYFLSSFKLASIDPIYLKQQIADTIMSSKSQVELQENFDRLVSKNFFWDVKGKPNQKQEKPYFEVPKYRVGNQKSQPIKFNVDINNASEFLGYIGYNEQVIDVWIKNQNNSTSKDSKTNTKSSSLDISTIKECNEILNLITSINTLLDTKPEISVLLNVKDNLNSLYTDINKIAENTRNMDTSTKGLILNVKNSFNSLSNRYNTVIGKILKTLNQDKKVLEEQYTKLSIQINEQFEKYKKYKDNVPNILKDYSYYLSQNAEISNQINALEQERLENDLNNLSKVTKYGAKVQNIFNIVCNLTELCLDKVLTENNLTNCKSVCEEDILKNNLEYLCKELKISSTNHFTGQIFIVLKQIKNNPKFSVLYNCVKNDLNKVGVKLDTQTSYDYPENYHGDTFTKSYIYDYLGGNPTEEDFKSVYYYNEILAHAWNTENTLKSKIQALESKQKEIKTELSFLKEMIDSGHSNKALGLSTDKQIDKYKQDKQELEEQINQLQNMYFNK